MLKSQILWRLYAGYVAIILVTTLIVSLLINNQMAKNGLEEINHNLEARTEYLSQIALPTLRSLTKQDEYSAVNSQNLQEIVRILGKKTNSRLTIIAADGFVIADSQEQPSKMDNHKSRPEIVLAGRTGAGTSSRFSNTLKVEMIYRAQSLKDDDKLLGYVRVSLTSIAIEKKLRQLQRIVIFSGVLASLTALAFGFYIARSFTQPLIKLTEVAEAISRGEYDKRIYLKQTDEIGQLASAFNRMAEASAHRMEEIISDRNILAMILTGMVEGVIGVDEKQNIIHINNAAAKMLGLSMTSSLNQPIWEQVRIQEINMALEQALERNGVVETQMRRPAEGEDLVVNIYVAVLLDNQQHLNGAVIVLHDISKLDLLGRIRRDFVANASHELKTPITAIKGLAETIIDDESMPSETLRSFIKKINVQSNRLANLISDLLSLSRLESDPEVDNFQLVNFSDLVERSIEGALINCSEKHLELVRENFPKERLQTRGDVQALSQLVDNLMDNAVKYTSNGGTITISLKRVDKFLNLQVSDTGIGISKLEQSRIFERFYRVDKARSRELGGTGLGLAIVKNISHQHGGSVTVKSQIGVGSVFTVHLPIS
ncbi:MAG: two-component system phosphate regulon sensor histidine kinase PhoR [Candidatus Azotimanducaceae bacterium]|jgi:two-component system phosphate regulon sensor histidine kinase PhoR